MTPPTISLDCRGAAFDPATFWLAIGLVWVMTVLAGLVALRVWARVAAFGTGRGCLGGFMLAWLGMTGWTIGVLLLLGFAVAMAGPAFGVSGVRVDGSLPGPAVAVVIAALSALAVELRPLRRHVWERVEPPARRKRVALMASLGLFGAAIGPAVGLLWVVYMYLSVGTCPRYGL